MQLQLQSIVRKLILILPVLLVIELGLNLGRINLWSSQYLHSVMGSPLSEPPFPYPPENHQRTALWLAQAAQRQGDLDEAKTILTPMVTRGDALAVSAYGDLLAAQGDFQAAIRSWEKVGNTARITEAARRATEIGDLDAALLAHQTILQFKPQSGVLPLANFLWDQMGDRPAAEAVLRQALADYPASGARKPWLRLLGSFVYRQERWGEAEALLQLYLAENPDDVSAWIDLGWLTYNRGDGLAAAQAVFDQAITVDTEHGAGYFAIAEMLVKENQLAEADSWFQQAIEREPDRREWYLARAGAQFHGGNLTGALDVYRQTSVRFPDYALAHYRLADAYELNGQPQEAMAAVKQALQLTENPTAWNYFRAGGMCQRAGDIEAAVQFYNLALALEPNNKDILDQLQQLDGSQ